MRRLSFTVSLASSLLLLTGSAAAEPFIPKMNDPESYKDFRFGLDEMRKNIYDVDCGGWDPDTSATVSGNNAGGFIPTPDISPDIPGRRNNDPMGRAPTGVGIRGDFEYPDSAWGYSSACNLYAETMFDEDLARLGKSIRFDGGAGIDDDPNVRVEDGDGTIDINPGRWCIRMDKATPRWCKKLFETWQQMAAIAPRPGVGEFCPCEGSLNGCPSRPEKRYCFDGPYTFECRGTSDQKTPVVTTFPDTPPQETTCRTTWRPDFSNKMTECHNEDQFDADGNYIGFISVTDRDGFHNALSSSYYRHYAESFMNPKISVEGGGKTWQVRGECYEYYKEEDPKEKVTSKDDEQCEFVISTPDEQNPDKPEWPDEEEQKKPPERADGPEVAANRSVVEEPSRDARDTPEPWVADPDTNLSLIDIERLRELQEDFENPSDISGILGALLPTRQRASKTVPKNARTDMFDDSDHRAVADYWEAQQRELIKMTADPRTKLIMPARFLVGINEDDPLFQYVTQKIVLPDGTVELTIKAGPEDLRGVVLSLQRMFIAPLQEVRIPVLVPLASDLEVNALIFQWEQWKKYEDADAAIKGRPSKAGQADDLIDKLRQYRGRLESMRRMRGALATMLTRLYDGQTEIREYFASWFEEQTAQFLLAIERAEQRRELRRIWRLLQRSMLQTDACQMLWCGNQRYSVPVYSLLDEWWGERSPGDNRDEFYEPRNDSRFDPPPDLRLLNYNQPEDTVFDFSDMRFPREPLLLPVLWPVQVKVRLPSPPMIGADPPSADDFPDLLDLPDETIFDSFEVPEVELAEKPTVFIPVPPDLTAAKDMLRTFREMVDGTTIPDQMAQEEALKNGDSIDQGDIPAPGEILSRDSMQHAYCRFQPSIIIPPDPEGKTGNPQKIIHVENDLRERLARLFVRWMPERMEDYAGRVARRNEDFPNPNDPPRCHEDVICYFLPPERTIITTWQWFMPQSAATGDFDSLADQLRDMTLPDDEDENPYEDASVSTLRRLFPKLPLPLEFKLVPDPPPVP